MRSWWVAAALLSLAVFSVVPRGMAQQENQAQEKEAAAEWQKEFDDVCSKTQDAMTFTVPELTKLVERCDALQPRIQKSSDESRRKVYLRRLQQCRGLYAYVLESKKNEKK